MPFVVTTPDSLAAAAQDLASLHSTLSEAAATAAAPTTAMAAAARDEVSIGIAALFGRFGQEYQASSAQARAFHQQFVDSLDAGAGAYRNAEVAAQQTLANAANASAGAVLQSGTGAAGGQALINGIEAFLSSPSGRAMQAPYRNLIANTTANVRAIGATWANSSGAALLQAVVTQPDYPQTILSGLATGNLAPLGTESLQLAHGYAAVTQGLAVPLSVSVTSLGPTGASLAVGAGVQQLLAFDALGAPVNAALALQASSSAFVGALAAGNPTAAMITLVDAPANIANGFLNGETVVSLGLTLPGLSVIANVPFYGILAPVQPLFSMTATVPGFSLLPTLTVTGPEVGGLIPGVANYVLP
ncbi:MAG: PE family protein [Mycobacterium sp.]|nr:PE family protein [Mycobacterium sp.]